jgi:hypothetical protein
MAGGVHPDSPKRPGVPGWVASPRARVNPPARMVSTLRPCAVRVAEARRARELRGWGKLEVCANALRNERRWRTYRLPGKR